ncbi:hypothetical protein [uncultured Marivita sp.]|jgi:hypothetical protein|uniref:Uncharacterized protein n=2 Tax=Sphingomonadales TaxID=204457 RepID=A0A4R6FRT3_9SPHN|nr:hypothetical protein [uncultured Marivita sp.]MCC4253320.1 hypothetical protein [Sphingobium naphthae]TDN84372.1 hypothetical protein EV664_10311 [Stakelama pacifica]GGO94003.1 hypothetical protein GCM10011329_14810 [Stakelama pacifica]
MIGTSTVFIFGLMYLNADHIFRSDARFWKAFVLGAAMMAVMDWIPLGENRFDVRFREIGVSG